MIERLAAAGIQHIEAGSFVSPKWVPQMATTADVIQHPNLKNIDPNKLCLSVLTPNLKGLEKAVELGVKEIAVFGAASEAFSHRNINKTIKDSVGVFKDIVVEAQKHNIRVRG